ncbi:MAG: DUF2691 family protein [Clostridium sp.]|nr:DUF2691 family protein [Clostridium sp.]
MKNIGVFFEVPNESLDNISNLLESIPFYEYRWLINNDEILIKKNNKITYEDLFKEEDRIIEGQKLYDIVNSNDYYTIFVNMYAFPKYASIKPIYNYEEFSKSDCNIVISIFDSSYVMFWCKDDKHVANIYNYAIIRGYVDVRYISDKDLLERKYYLD